MNTTIKYIFSGLVLCALVFGIYSCNKAKSNAEKSASETIATSYSVSVITAAKKDMTDSFFSSRNHCCVQ